jgi:hypothetical protein
MGRKRDYLVDSSQFSYRMSFWRSARKVSSHDTIIACEYAAGWIPLQGRKKAVLDFRKSEGRLSAPSISIPIVSELH